MAEKETEDCYTKNYFINRRDNLVINQEVAIFKQEDMPFLINIIKELHPTVRLSDYKTLGMLAIKEFNMKVPEKEFERYFSPSVEGITKDYEIKLNAIE